jgi:hypothetical protein
MPKLMTGDIRSGIKVPDVQMAQIDLRRENFHGEWNYEIMPRNANIIT